MKRLIQPQHANGWRAGGPGCMAVFCLAALLAALTVGCGGAHSSTLAYVSDSTGTGFTVFTVNNNGTLTASNISPLNTTAPPGVMQITANGKWAYFLNGSASGPCAKNSCIFGFRRTGDGKFDTPVNGAFFPLTSTGSSIVTTPDKNCSPCFVYAAIPATKEIAVFRIEDSTGELTQVGNNKPAGATITQLAIAPDGLALYGLAPTDHEVVGFRLEAGGVVINTNTPGPVGPAPADNGMILSADGNFIYVPDQVQTDLTQTQAPGITLTGQSPTTYILSTKNNNQEGALLFVSVFQENADLVSQTFPSQPVGGATSNDSRWLFIANQNSHNISVFDIHTQTGASPQEVGGTITQVNGQPVSTASPFDCGAACLPNFIAVSKLNNAIYVLDTFHNKIFQFAVDQNSGRLRPLSPASVDAGATPVWITIK